MNNPEPTWVKSSYSSQGNCVEVADHSSRVLVRDTKQDGAGPVLRFSPVSWRRFTGQVKQSLSSDVNRASRRL